jgi:hypothetical protein
MILQRPARGKDERSVTKEAVCRTGGVSNSELPSLSSKSFAPAIPSAALANPLPPAVITLLPSAFPVIISSLPWQLFGFDYKLAQKRRVSAPPPPPLPLIGSTP